MTFCSHTSSQSPFIYYPSGPHDYREITLALVNGVDISLVSPDLYENLLPYLDQYILKFQDRNDISAINRLKFCKEYIYQLPERERIAKILTKKRNDRPPEPLPFNQEQLDEEIEKLLKAKKINASNANYSQREIDQLLNEMKNRRLEAAEEDDFDLADRLALVSSQLSNQGAINQIRKIKIDQAEEFKQKLEETKHTYNDLRERWNNLQTNFREETTKELNQMKENQRKEKIELAKKKDGPIPPKFRKHTQEYLILKQEEKMLVAAKRFDEATVIQQRVREQEEFEDRLILQDWLEYVDKEQKKLVEKHKQQLKVREMNIKKEQNNIERTKKKELDALKNKIKFLEKQISELEQYGAPNSEISSKISNTPVTAKNDNNEEEEKKSEYSYYYSYYDSRETDDEKSKISAVCNDKENEIFFTENQKSEIIEKNANEEEEESNEKINKNENNQNTENISKEEINDQISENQTNEQKFDIRPPNEDESQRSGYKKRNKKGNSSGQNENSNNNNQKSPKIKSSAYYANSTTSLPRLPNSVRHRRAKKELNGPEAFRQRALLNRQLYCGKTLFSQHEKNQKDHQRQKRKKEVHNDDSM